MFDPRRGQHGQHQGHRRCSADCLEHASCQLSQRPQQWVLVNAGTRPLPAQVRALLGQSMADTGHSMLVMTVEQELVLHIDAARLAW